MIVDTGTLTTVLDQYLSIFQLGRQDMSGHAWGLLTALVTLEILLASFAWLLSGSDALVGIIKKLLTIGFFVFVIQNYDSLMRTVIDGFIQTGKIASSASGDPFSSVRDPSSIVSAGFIAALPILDHLSSYGYMDVLSNFVDIVITSFCALGVVLSYFIIAIYSAPRNLDQ